MTKRSASWFLFAAVIVLTVLAYLRTLEYGQVNWDNQLSGTSSYQESPELDTFRSILVAVTTIGSSRTASSARGAPGTAAAAAASDITTAFPHIARPTSPSVPLRMGS